MQLNERFVVGRVKRRMLRAPTVDGWLADELGTALPGRGQYPLQKLDGARGLALAIPGQNDLAKLGETASELVGSLDGCELLIGWPEHLVIVRQRGIFVYGEGDIVHFGSLALDRDHRVERTGYEYLTDTGAEVRVELTTSEAVHLLGPGEAITVGPYRIAHERSFDPSDRPSGARHHGYDLRCERASDAPRQARAADVPHPLDVANAAQVVALARARALLGVDEALLAEPTVLSSLLDRYEGPRHNLEQTLVTVGPQPSAVRRLGDKLLVESPYVARGEHGEPHHGRAEIILDATGGVYVTRRDHGSMPGRLRKRH